ncbi:MAG: diguanylate cyclase, partial [Cyanobacteria bacterium REEB65]|nr:diguanylate cyclase [Cyanobacteria bacterium REEB65]
VARMRIMIAEDDPVSCLILQKSIEKLGHQCVIATNGDEAWKLFQMYRADVIISDWVMPGLTGPELCQKVRTSQSVGYTYFVLLTSLAEKQNYIDGMQAGADDYLTKPLDRDDLQMRLIAATRVTSLHRQLLEQTRELERLNRELYQEGRKDALTGLRNRLCMQEDLRAMQDRAQRYGHSFCLALADIDYYKFYNDHYGHMAGDEALKQVATVMQSQLRSGDAVYRYGGEEFLVVLPEQALPVAGLVMQRIGQAVWNLGIPHLASPFGALTISVGVAKRPPADKVSIDEVLNAADTALYFAKEHGRNRVALSDGGTCDLY